MTNAIPPLLAPRLDDLPAELTDRPQWVVWRGVWLADKTPPKWSKVPVNAKNGRAGKSTGPETWADFETARRAYQQNAGIYTDAFTVEYGGVGFVLTENDPIAGIDIDHAILKYGGERRLTEEAARFVALLDTYTEVSPSGTGLRLFVRANLPPGGRKKGDVEMYETRRFLTVTGRRWPGTPAEIADRQAQVEALHREVFPPAPPKTKPAAEFRPDAIPADDTDLLSLALQARNGGRVGALMAGNTSAYDGDSSAADLALCSFLVFYTGPDAHRLDRLFRGSGLYRAKWDQKHYSDGRTYGQATIQKAIDGCSEFYKPKSRRTKQATPAEIGDAAKRAAQAASPSKKAETAEDVPPAAGRTEKGQPEYAPYQIAQILRLTTEAPDTDAALACRAVRLFASDLRFCKELGWLVWDGRRWQRDDRDGSRTAAQFVTLSKTIREEAAGLFRRVADLLQQGRAEDAGALERAARMHLRHVKTVESEPFAQRAMVLSRPPLTVEAKVFEPRAWLIGFENGVWDKGVWREHRREDNLLELCPVNVPAVGEKSGREWQAVLERISGGDKEYEKTLQDVAGYAMSGASHLRTLPWAYGPPGTGKSTLAELLMTVLGSSAASVDTKLLGSDAPRERLGALLWGKRLVVCAEAGQQRIDAELLKTLSGGDSYPVRFHYQETFTAKPTHVLLMTANDPPSMNAYDDALKSRVVALPCDHRLDGIVNEGDPPLFLHFADGGRIEAVRQKPGSPLVRGFTVWAIAGMAHVFQTERVYTAEIAQNATARFWRETDPLTMFWETVDVEKLRFGITRPDLRRIYEYWCETEGIRRPVGAQIWTQACLSAGLKEVRIGNGRGWRLSGEWQFTYTSYTLSPDSDKTCVSENSSHKGFTENRPGSVRSVRAENPVESNRNGQHPANSSFVAVKSGENDAKSAKKDAANDETDDVEVF